jgi:predicted N-acetyltransferase YhbS
VAPHVKKIRFGRWDDFPQMESILREAFPDNPRELRSRLRELEQHLPSLLVCLEDDALVGFGALTAISPSVYLLCCDFVAPTRRNQGIGRLLLQARLVMLDLNLAPIDFGLVAEDESRGFYEHLGFAAEGEPFYDPIRNRDATRLHRSFSAEDMQAVEAALMARSDVVLAFDEMPPEEYALEEEG